MATAGNRLETSPIVTSGNSDSPGGTAGRAPIAGHLGARRGMAASCWPGFCGRCRSPSNF